MRATIRPTLSPSARLQSSGRSGRSEARQIAASPRLLIGLNFWKTILSTPGACPKTKLWRNLMHIALNYTHGMIVQRRLLENAPQTTRPCKRRIPPDTQALHALLLSRRACITLAVRRHPLCLPYSCCPSLLRRIPRKQLQVACGADRVACI